MPSSLIFAGLVATWLAVLVPMVARRRLPMSRPSDAALSCRVLERPRRGQRSRSQEVTAMDDATPGRGRGASVAPDLPDQLDEFAAPEPSAPAAPRYRPGRGGYDPDAAALAAQAKYAFRQRMVLVLVIFAVISGGLAGTLRMVDAWYLHGMVDLCLVGYLAYLRRQVRLEQAIRARRAARAAGSRRGPTAGEAGLPDRSRPSGASADATIGEPRRPRTVAEAVAARADSRRTEATRRTGETDTDHPSVTPARTSPTADPEDLTTEPDDLEEQLPTLPRLRATPMPRPVPGTVRLELDDEDPELHHLADRQRKGYRRAAGQ